ncbi:MAG: alpha/beta hydrolase fold domain-containing protein [Armatimonadota bacterium]|jgi:acetyl esterase/lipase
MTHALRVVAATAVTLLFIGAGLLPAQPQGPRQQGISPQESAFLEAEPRVGERAPDFTLSTPGAAEISLAELYAEKPVVLQFGSVTCPVYRGKIERMNRLREQFGDAFHWLIVYTIEAHPADGPDPYTGRIWPHQTNEREGLLLQQPRDYEGRVAMARKVIDDYGEQTQIVIDGMDNAVWEAWGKRPNSAFVIDEDGIVRAKQFWSNAGELAAVLRDMGSGQATPPPGEARVPVPNPDAFYRDGAWVLRDVQYGDVDGHPLLLDAYLPADDAINPAVVFIHGGGWRNGDKAGGFRAVRGDRFIAQGVAVISIGYRLSGVAPYPAAVDDCLAAVRWIRENAEGLKVDPDRMAVWGGSAGGHLALMMGFREPGPEDAGADGAPPPNFFRCVVALNPPTDLTADDEMHRERALLAFMAATREEAPERYAEASPLTHLSADDPPVFIMHGTADRTVPYNQALVLQERMEEVGVPVTLVTFEGAGHGLSGADREDVEATMQRAVEFVLEHLGF